jgi:hypothetical protein
MFRLPNESGWSAQKQRPDPQPIRLIDRKSNAGTIGGPPCLLDKSKRPDRRAVRASCVTIARQPP